MAGLRPAEYYKGSQTLRISTVTLADDPDLSNIPLDPGYYSIKVLLMHSTASAAAKLKTRWAFTGSWTSPIRSCHGPGVANTAAADALNLVTMKGIDAGADAIYDTAVISSPGAAIEEKAFRVEILASGVFSVQWAQGVNTASNIAVNAGSVVEIAKVDDL
jgi:hypothetical protein